jgi:aminoglycoside/choline kinase family phosphotransferase
LLEIATALAWPAKKRAVEGAVEVMPISRGGSERHFFRLSRGGHSVVALIQPGGGPEFDSYIVIGEFLQRNSIIVPEFQHVDRGRGIAIMNDLGDVHLEDVLRGASDDRELSLYRQCIEILVTLQTSVTLSMEREGVLAGRQFDLDVLLGETAYFVEEFINGYCPIGIPDGWEKERHYLAERLASLPAVFMHRDFQSRNILVKDGRLAVVDFQTAHRGPGLYDAASLLKDAYHPLSRENRRVLLRALYDGLHAAGSGPLEGFDTFEETFTIAGIQRNLQALAAFAKLGQRRGKREFLDSIPDGLTLLEEGVDEAGNLEALKMMVREIRSQLQKGIT